VKVHSTQSYLNIYKYNRYLDKEEAQNAAAHISQNRDTASTTSASANDFIAQTGVADASSITTEYYSISFRTMHYIMSYIHTVFFFLSNDVNASDFIAQTGVANSSSITTEYYYHTLSIRHTYHAVYTHTVHGDVL
jgi:hypothetical protein